MKIKKKGSEVVEERGSTLFNPINQTIVSVEYKMSRF